MAVFITAIIVFSFLMAVREEFHSIWVRAGVAGLAAAILAAGIYHMGARKKGIREHRFHDDHSR